MHSPKPFLTAKWLKLAMLNWQIDPELLNPFVPRGTEVDFYEGRTYVSVVGFLFQDTKVLGVGIPWHRDFDEINLRFYLRRTVNGETRRGVAFVQEIVPRRAIATLARVVYNEPYVARAMRHSISDDAVAYEWREKGHWQGFSMAFGAPMTPLQSGSLEEFIAEHYYGYCAQRDGSTIEYRVEHPRWNVANATATTIDERVASFYPSAFAEVLRRPPTNAFLADGSEVTVFRPITIA